MDDTPRYSSTRTYISKINFDKFLHNIRTDLASHFNETLQVLTKRSESE